MLPTKQPQRITIYKLLRYAACIYLGIWVILIATSPYDRYLLNRRYLLAKSVMGIRDSMYDLAVEYDRDDYNKEAVRNSHYKAGYWYLKAAERGCPHSINRLAGSNNFGSWNLQWLARGVELKIEDCLNRTAQGYRFGVSGFSKNPLKEMQLNRECEKISLLRRKLPMPWEKSDRLNGVEVEHQFDVYRKSLESEVQKGHSESALPLFQLMVGLDNSVAINWLKLGAEKDPACAIELANAFQDGKYGLPWSKDEFYRWFLHARELKKQNGALP